MGNNERSQSKELLFEGAKIYYSGSIRGVKNPEPDFAYNLVQFMIENGADVLSEHVGARSQEEMDEVFLRKSGVDRRTLQEPWFAAREIDMAWVDEATHLIAVVNGPSHGVGMEIERALLKPERGLNKTPVLCLIHEDLFDKLTWMIRGVSETDSNVFSLKTYTNMNNAKLIIKKYLLNST